MVYHVHIGYIMYILATFVWQVGSLSGKSEFNLNLAAFSQYREDGTPDLRKGQCPAGKICNECIEKDIPEHKIHMPGDIYVVGRTLSMPHRICNLIKKLISFF